MKMANYNAEYLKSVSKLWPVVECFRSIGQTLPNTITHLSYVIVTGNSHQGFIVS